jgi:hypothetical protein
MEILQQPIAGMPLWIWAIIVGGGGLALAWYLRRQGSKSGALGQNAAGQMPQLDPSLYDPYTGVPLSIESATNPATGLPNYYNPSTPQTAPSGAPTSGSPQLTNSRYTLPSDMTTNDLARQFGLRGGWADIAYNPNNAQLDSGTFLSEAYSAKGNNVIKKGTAVWIPTTQMQGNVTGTGPTDQATPYWPQMTDVQGVH